MLRKLLGIAGVSSLLIASPLSTASAADMPLKAPPRPAPVMSWTGCYVDAGGGYGMWDADHYGVSAAGVPFDLSSTSGGRGWLGRVGVGCDYQVAPKWVIGALADYDFMNIHGTVVDPLGATGGVQLDEKENWAWAAGARLGYVITPGVLTYISAGYTETHFNGGAFVSSAAGAPSAFTLAGQRFQGWFLGSGFETTLSDYVPGLPPGLFLRTEYRFSSFDSANDPVFAVAPAAGGAENIHPYVQTVTTSLVWKFNVFGH